MTCPDGDGESRVARNGRHGISGVEVAAWTRYPAQVDKALRAGATWEQIAAATGTTEGNTRAAYREWADGQHRLYADMAIGLSDDEYAQAVELAAASSG
jgi:hypothetical protein